MQVLIAFAFSVCVMAAQPSSEAPPEWSRWQFLIGEWVGEGGGGPGHGTGGFSFQFDLDHKIIIRKNHAEYPATRNGAAYTHDDLMIVYPDAKKTRAIYFDNEGHVIHYGAHFSPDGKKLTLLRNPSASTPGYRLSYIQSDTNKVKIQFEIAPPGKPGEFHMYLQASARRKLL